MTHPPDDDRAAAALARLAQEVDPPPAAYRELVRRLEAEGRITRPSRLTGWIAAAVAATVAALIAVRSVPAPPASQQFLLLLEEPAGYDAAQGPLEARARVTEYTAWARKLAGEHHLVTAGELDPGGVVVAPQGRRALADTAMPTGYFLLRAVSLEEAERLARESPHLKYGGEVVIRPVTNQ